MSKIFENLYRRNWDDRFNHALIGTTSTKNFTPDVVVLSYCQCGCARCLLCLFQSLQEMIVIVDFIVKNNNVKINILSENSL